MKTFQQLIESFGNELHIFPPEVRKYIATEFKLSHNLKVEKYNVDDYRDWNRAGEIVRNAGFGLLSNVKKNEADIRNSTC